MSRLRVSKRLYVVSSLVVVAFATWICGEKADADFADILHKDLQAVSAVGLPTLHPNPLSIVGVVINNPWDMLDSSGSATSPQWQVFIQTIDPLDYGGTALYMRMFNPAGTVKLYDDSAWSQEMDRLNHPGSVSAPLQRGDVIRVDARAPGLGYKGKFNINEKHSNDPDNDFDIEIIRRGETPLAAPISLSDLKNASNDFIFDLTRATGAEHYQGSLVHLDNLMWDGDLSEWQPDGTVTVRQGSLTMDLKLGLDEGLLSVAPTAGTPFSVTAILDQESASGKDGYRLWLTNAADFSVVPEPSTMVLVLLGGALMYPVLRQRGARRRVQS